MVLWNPLLLPNRRMLACHSPVCSCAVGQRARHWSVQHWQHPWSPPVSPRRCQVDPLAKCQTPMNNCNWLPLSYIILDKLWGCFPEPCDWLCSSMQWSICWISLFFICGIISLYKSSLLVSLHSFSGCEEATEGSSEAGSCGCWGQGRLWGWGAPFQKGKGGAAWWPTSSPRWSGVVKMYLLSRLWFQGFGNIYIYISLSYIS